MEVHLTAHQHAFLEQRISDGRFASADEAMQQAVALLEEREHTVKAVKQTSKPNLAQLFADSPFRGLNIDFERDPSPIRDLDL